MEYKFEDYKEAQKYFDSIEDKAKVLLVKPFKSSKEYKQLAFYKPGITLKEQKEFDKINQEASTNASFMEQMPSGEEKDLLLKPNLFEMIVEDEFDKRITGEKQSRKAIFLSLCSIWIKDMRVPLNTIVSSVSSAGKSYICKQIVELFPANLVIYRSKISGEAFTYWHVNEKDWTWDGKILVLEDIGQAVIDSPTFRVMCSDGSVATVVRNQKAVDLFVNGKPCMLLTTASTSPSKEVLNRFNIVQLDESAKQTEDVAYNEALESKNIPFDPLITKALSLLKRREVHVPFSLDMHNYINKNYGYKDVRMRRDFSRLRDLIKCSTVLYQLQREEQNGKLVATKQDYEIARECINYIQTMTLKGLIHKLRKVYEACIKEDEFTAKDIHASYPFVSLKMWYNYLDALCERELLNTELREVEGVKQKVTYFIVKKGTNLVLPEFEQLKQLKPFTSFNGSKQQQNTLNNQIISQESDKKVTKVSKDNEVKEEEKEDIEVIDFTKTKIKEDLESG